MSYIGPWEGEQDANVVAPAVADGVALALSGGGFRATLFHLGVVERLYLLGALDRVTYLTSVSGGSILAGTLALAWRDLMNPNVDNRAERFDALVRQPIIELAKLNLRDRALRRAVLHVPWRRPIECLAQLLDQHLYKGATFASLPNDLLVGFNSCDLNNGKRFVFHKQCFGDVESFTTTACGALPVATAVAASAAFPMGFAPFVLELRGPWGNWPDGQWSEHRKQRDAKIPFGDGGIYENLALQAATRLRKDVFLSNFGEAVDYDVPFAAASPVATAMRSILILMGRNARVATDEFIGSGKAKSGVIVENMQYAAHLARKTGGAPGFDQHEARLLARLRTDLDDFDDNEIEALRYHGASLADVNLRQRQPLWIDAARERAAGAIGVPPKIDWKRIADGAHHHFGDLFLKFWRT